MERKSHAVGADAGGRLKVAHIVHWPVSGIGVFVGGLVRHASPDIEHTVYCLTRGSPLTDDLRRAGAKVMEWERDARCLLSRVLLVRRLTREATPDVVHTHSFTPRLLAATARLGIPHVATVHSTYPHFRGLGIRSVVKRSLECYVARKLPVTYACVSEGVADSLPCAAMRRNSLAILNGVDIERMRRLADDDIPTPRVGAPLLVAVGRLEREKGFDLLLSAVTQARVHLPGLGVVLCGQGTQRPELEAQAQTMGISDAVYFAGHVQNVAPYYRAADALVCTSLFEGFSLTAAEAMSLGRPVISTPVRGVSSVIRDGETGFIANGFSVPDILDVLLRALSDRPRLERVGKAGQRIVEELFDVRRTVRDYEQLYRKVTGRGRIHPGSADRPK